MSATSRKNKKKRNPPDELKIVVLLEGPNSDAMEPDFMYGYEAANRGYNPDTLDSVLEEDVSKWLGENAMPHEVSLVMGYLYHKLGIPR